LARKKGQKQQLGVGFLRAPVGAINRGNSLRACGEKILIEELSNLMLDS
jgi:hypothetical protein